LSHTTHPKNEQRSREEAVTPAEAAPAEAPATASGEPMGLTGDAEVDSAALEEPSWADAEPVEAPAASLSD
jgi:hypothetical protein